jgi:type IV secretory pathway protease TraF
MRKRLATINGILACNPNMWAGAKTGYIRERNKLVKQISEFSGDSLDIDENYVKIRGETPFNPQ